MTLHTHPPVTSWHVITRLQRVWDEIGNGDSGFGLYTTTLRKLGVITVSQEALLDGLCSRFCAIALEDRDLYEERVKLFFQSKGLLPHQLAFAPVCETLLELGQRTP